MKLSALCLLAFFAPFALHANISSEETEILIAKTEAQDEEGQEENEPSLLEEAQKGEQTAQYDYGMNQYKKGNYREAAKWWLKAAQSGNDMAQFQLGKSHRDGKGVDKNYVKAYFLFSLSAQQGNEDAKKSKARLEKAMSQQQLKEAQDHLKKLRKD